MKRPAGVLVIAMMQFITGVLNLGIIYYTYFTAFYPTDSLSYMTVISTLDIIFATGLWFGRRWGRTGSILLAGWGVAVGVLGLVALTAFVITSPDQSIISIAVNLLVIYYLTRPVVAEFFKQ
jgi:uncharacterized membrane protein (DUF2068 family)